MDTKFRAWIKEEKRMVDVAVLYASGTIGEAVNDGKQARLFGKDEVELMQYTGLKDKNGKEIFAGDVLLAGSMKHIVLYNPNFAAFVLKGLVSQYSRLTKEWIEICEVEVIGNIHDNHELLEVEK